MVTAIAGRPHTPLGKRPSRESGDRFLAEFVVRSEGERLMHQHLRLAGQLLTIGIGSLCAQTSGIRGARVECASSTALTGLDGRFLFPRMDRCAASVSALGFEQQSLELTALREYKKENVRLRNLLGFRESPGYESIPAEIVAHDPAKYLLTMR